MWSVLYLMFICSVFPFQSSSALIMCALLWHNSTKWQITCLAGLSTIFCHKPLCNLSRTMKLWQKHVEVNLTKYALCDKALILPLPIHDIDWSNWRALPTYEFVPLLDLVSQRLFHIRRFVLCQFQRLLQLAKQIYTNIVPIWNCLNKSLQKSFRVRIPQEIVNHGHI